MTQIADTLRDSKRLRLIATALELMQYEHTDSAVIPIPGTEPQRYVTVGTAATVARLLEIAPTTSTVSAPSKTQSAPVSTPTSDASHSDTRAAANAGGQAIQPQTVSDERKAFDAYWNALDSAGATDAEIEMCEYAAWQAWQARPRHCLALPLSAYPAGTTYRAPAADAGGQDAAVAAIEFALSLADQDAMLFLKWWNEGEFDKLRKHWIAPTVPEAVFIGADPMHPQTRTPTATSAAALSEELKYEYRGFYVVEYNHPEVKGASITGTYNNTRLPECMHFASKEACMGYIDCHLDDTPAQGAVALRTTIGKGEAA